MNVNRKLEIFSNAVDKEVERRRISILLNMDHQIENAVHENISKAKKEYADELDLLKGRIYEENESKISKRKSVLKKELIHKRQEYSANIFDAVERRLKEYCSSGKYRDQLYEDIKGYILNQNDFDIYIMSGDIETVRLLEQGFSEEFQQKNIKIVVSAEDFIGGFKICYKGINVIVNNTFSAKLEKEQKEFNRFKIGMQEAGYGADR